MNPVQGVATEKEKREKIAAELARRTQKPCLRGVLSPADASVGVGRVPGVWRAELWLQLTAGHDSFPHALVSLLASTPLRLPRGLPASLPSPLHFPVLTTPSHCYGILTSFQHDPSSPIRHLRWPPLPTHPLPFSFLPTLVSSNVSVALFCSSVRHSKVKGLTVCRICVEC
ncbi:hypothetical protein E2C01_086786 [Portunus trituberculatus]|uniref:Uncharacterized protein n=1 Tax=Portunus trituberculatus TaxID=210409 RepID=A0A5B7J4R7_PORTR|nr:hypothetical protein [Portunus trituberculatus]